MATLLTALYSFFSSFEIEFFLKEVIFQVSSTDDNFQTSTMLNGINISCWSPDSKPINHILFAVPQFSDFVACYLQA